MMYDYNTQSKYPMTLNVNGQTIKGEFLLARIDPLTIPKEKAWYQLRHDEEDWSKPVSIARGGIAVNFLGTFICDPIDNMDFGDEVDIEEKLI